MSIPLGHIDDEIFIGETLVTLDEARDYHARLGKLIEQIDRVSWRGDDPVHVSELSEDVLTLSPQTLEPHPADDRMTIERIRYRPWEAFFTSDRHRFTRVEATLRVVRRDDMALAFHGTLSMKFDEGGYLIAHPNDVTARYALSVLAAHLSRQK